MWRLYCFEPIAVHCLYKPWQNCTFIMNELLSNVLGYVCVVSIFEACAYRVRARQIAIGLRLITRFRFVMQLVFCFRQGKCGSRCARMTASPKAGFKRFSNQNRVKILFQDQSCVSLDFFEVFSEVLISTVGVCTVFGCRQTSASAVAARPRPSIKWTPSHKDREKFLTYTRLVLADRRWGSIKCAMRLIWRT